MSGHFVAETVENGPLQDVNSEHFVGRARSTSCVQVDGRSVAETDIFVKVGQRLGEQKAVKSIAEADNFVRGVKAETGRRVVDESEAEGRGHA